MNKPTAVVVGVGAERGLGAALCRRFAQGGYHVLVAGRTQAKIGRVAGTIAAAGGSAEPIAMDATRESDVAGLFERAIAPGDGFDPTELVVSNAGNNQRRGYGTSSSARTAGRGTRPCVSSLAEFPEYPRVQHGDVVCPVRRAPVGSAPGGTALRP